MLLAPTTHRVAEHVGHIVMPMRASPRTRPMMLHQTFTEHSKGLWELCLDILEVGFTSQVRALGDTTDPFSTSILKLRTRRISLELSLSHSKLSRLGMIIFGIVIL